MAGLTAAAQPRVAEAAPLPLAAQTTRPESARVLQARVAAVRAARPPLAGLRVDEGTAPVTLAQAANWTNWPKWSKWSNWANK